MKKIILSLLLAFAGSLSCFAQDDKAALCQEISNGDVVKKYEKAIDKKKTEFKDRLKLLAEVLEAEPDFAEANLEYGKLLMTVGRQDGDKFNYGPALKYLKKAVEVCPQLGAEPLYWIGSKYYVDEKYDEAVTYLDKYVKYETDDSKKLGKDYEFNSGQSVEMIKWSKFYINIKKNQKPFQPVPVENICTQHDEYLAIITPDNTQCWYIRTQPYNKMDSPFQSDKMIEVFTMSERQPNGQFNKGTMLDEPFNRNPNEGGPTLSIDNRHLVFTITKPSKEGQNTDLYTTDFVDGGWTAIRPLGDKVNDPVYWDSQPSMSSDGKTLYFVSDRPGGLGGTDIYVTKKQADGSWGTPVNAGEPINTTGNERSPFIHSDSETLYLSSDGHPGVGGLDIFYARKDDKGKWKEPVNIGIPINTEEDDLGFFVSTDGNLGYFSSRSPNIPGGKGGHDLYSFKLYKEAQPDAVVIVKGEVKQPDGNNFSGKIDVEIKSAQTGKKIDVVVDTTSGHYATAIKVSKKEDYVVTLKKEGVAFSSQLIEAAKVEEAVKKPDAPPVKLEALEVKEVKLGEQYTLNNIYFGSNSASLEARSKSVLKEFAVYLKENANIRIEIHGHTDDVGDRGANLSLSKERALVVLEALTEEFGVPKNQITSFIGHGPDQPLDTAKTDAARAKNRRTEFWIVGK
ncbi:MAG: outer membrane protein/peptidoglycan-associated (lipo)protein [Bacteroidetes bacterium]|nr:MAG: outer membrane protein/peptidoglycan-associated (lipo)protein [Bacteroidota bacterium]